MLLKELQQTAEITCSRVCSKSSVFSLQICRNDVVQEINRDPAAYLFSEKSGIQWNRVLLLLLLLLTLQKAAVAA
jgi:hypothetical protein